MNYFYLILQELYFTIQVSSISLRPNINNDRIRIGSFLKVTA
jgi:hypothetical protein